MKTALQTIAVLVLSYFAIVPPKMEKQIETIKVSDESIKLEKIINSRIDTIKTYKDSIYCIQEELNIN